MFGFDSVSRMTFMRLLPKTYSFLLKELGAIVMKGELFLNIGYLVETHVYDTLIQDTI